MAQADTPAFVLIKLPLGDARAERAALRDAGLPVFIKGNTLCPDQESVYAIAADAMYSPAHRDGILDMLAVLGVPHILHVGSDRQVTRCRKDNNYLPIGSPVIGTWESTGIVYSDGYNIRGRNFYVKQEDAAWITTAQF